MNDSESQHTSRRLGTGMVVAAWVLILGLLTMFFSDELAEQRNPNQQVASRTGADGTAQVTLQRNRFGHYVATGYINGEAVEFMLDTGASDVSVPAAVADRLGLERGFARSYHTANGTIQAYTTVLDRVRLGDIVVENVSASINPNVHGEEILLGMSFLKHLEFTQRQNILTLRQFVPAAN